MYQGCLWLLNNYVKCIIKTRQGFEKTLDAAINMTTGDIGLSGLIEQYNEALKNPRIVNPSVANQPNNNEKMDMPKEHENVQKEGFDNMASIEKFVDEGSQFATYEKGSGSGTRMEEMEDWGPETQRLAVELVESTEVSGFDSPGAMIGPLTQAAFVEVADEVERSIEKAKAIKELEEGPSFSLGFTQPDETAKEMFVTPVSNEERKNLTPVPISFVPPKDPVNHNKREGKRQTSKTETIRSPFVSRIVEIEPNFTNEESRLNKYLFLMTAEDMS